MFIEALFTTAKTWKQSKCPSTEEWIKRIWYIYTMGYYIAPEKNEMISFITAQMDLEIVILNEVSQIEKEKYSMTYHMWNRKRKLYKWNYLQNRKRLTDVENKLMVAERKRQLGRLI